MADRGLKQPGSLSLQSKALLLCRAASSLPGCQGTLNREGVSKILEEEHCLKLLDHNVVSRAALDKQGMFTNFTLY